MNILRRSGILLHPTSLPGNSGIGDLGEHAYRFIDFLQRTGQQLWQVMPLGPTGYGDSPYQCFSAFAGNPLLINLEALVAQGLLAQADLADTPAFPRDHVDYGWIIPFKIAALRRAFERMQASDSAGMRQAINHFRAANAAWLDDYALFAAIKAAHGGASWNTWEDDIARHQPEALQRWAAQLSEEVQFHAFMQFLFFQQWGQLKSYANERGIQIIGDIPIFVAYDSADVWGNREIFALDEQGEPTVVAGVPPDYFSATGQRWGNPLYRWDVLEKRGFDWWVSRFRAMLNMVDIIRLDHFRGFAAYWEVPASEETAINGRWVPGPGARLFEAIKAELGSLPIIAEDLGVITPDVEELRDQFEFPGMKVLHFAFGDDDPENAYQPHNYPTRCVVYTGTHDNDTTLGWWQAMGDTERARVQTYLARDGHDICWDMVRLAFASVAEIAVVPLQDVLGLGSEARMNTPGQPGGNWGWRYQPEQLGGWGESRLHDMTKLYGRAPKSETEKA
ncbi:4-alpha-glucanotransferase [Chloroflexia bacterium SDU3-3]|nr:4-alpha-glucanotransferase [Chloroflexia bacterium SDU3-3]